MGVTVGVFAQAVAVGVGVIVGVQGVWLEFRQGVEVGAGDPGVEGVLAAGQPTIMVVTIPKRRNNRPEFLKFMKNLPKILVELSWFQPF